MLSRSAIDTLNAFARLLKGEFMPNLDSQLISAIDDYLAALRQRMIRRIEKGEMSYRGAWHNMTIDELYEAITEEDDDAHVYHAMIQSKELKLDA